MRACFPIEAGSFLPHQPNPILNRPPHKGDPVKRAVLYLRVSTVDRQNPETQGLELRQFAIQRGFEVIHEYVDHGVSGAKIRRPGLDQLLRMPTAANLTQCWSGHVIDLPEVPNTSCRFWMS
jgi:hypothetical protein